MHKENKTLFHEGKTCAFQQEEKTPRGRSKRHSKSHVHNKLIGSIEVGVQNHERTNKGQPRCRFFFHSPSGIGVVVILAHEIPATETASTVQNNGACMENAIWFTQVSLQGVLLPFLSQFRAARYSDILRHLGEAKITNLSENPHETILGWGHGPGEMRRPRFRNEKIGLAFANFVR